MSRTQWAIRKIYWLAFGVAGRIHAAETRGAAGSDAGLWIQTATVLAVSFGLAVTTCLLLDLLRSAREREKPGEDAYLDQLEAGNGTRLTPMVQPLRRYQLKGGAGAADFS